jgi:hypothetical protein
MAELRGGSKVGGYTALHSGLKNAFLYGTLTISGNTGIGAGATTGPIDTNNPNRAYLTLRGAGSTTNGDNMGVLEFGDAATDQDGRHLGLIQGTDALSTSADKRATGIWMFSDGTTANNRGGALGFYTKANGASGMLERMRITQGGTVLVGTSTAYSYRMQVHQSGDVWHMAVGDMTAGVIRFAAYSGSGATIQSVNQATSATRDLYLQRDGGNVGIGTASAVQKLEVTGNIQITANGGTLKLAGTDHAYIEYYPKGIATGRKAYLGYSSGTATDFTIDNQLGSIVTTATFKPYRLVVPVGTDLYAT